MRLRIVMFTGVLVLGAAEVDLPAPPGRTTGVAAQRRTWPERADHRVEQRLLVRLERGDVAVPEDLGGAGSRAQRLRLARRPVAGLLVRRQR